MAKPLPLPRKSDVQAHDNALRWLVRSRHGPIKHLVDLGGYNGNGRCSCTDFQTRMEPILKKELDPSEAVESGVLKQRNYHEGPWAAAQCYHIFRARNTLTDAFIKKLRAVEAAQATAPRQ
mgnify:CR=1 FL=1